MKLFLFSLAIFLASIDMGQWQPTDNSNRPKKIVARLMHSTHAESTHEWEKKFTICLNYASLTFVRYVFINIRHDSNVKCDRFAFHLRFAMQFFFSYLVVKSYSLWSVWRMETMKAMWEIMNRNHFFLLIYNKVRKFRLKIQINFIIKISYKQTSWKHLFHCYAK